MTWSNTKRAVLVPYDFTAPSAAGLEVARSFVEDPTHVTVLHVVEPLPHLATRSEELNREHMAELDTTKRELELYLAERGFGDYRVEVRFGKAADRIVQYVHDAGVELVVIPSHSRKKAARFFLGSVAERVVRHAECPVLVLGRAANV